MPGKGPGGGSGILSCPPPPTSLRLTLPSFTTSSLFVDSWPALVWLPVGPVGPGEVEDGSHFFLFCPWVANLWEALCVRLLGLVPVPGGWEMLMLAFPSVACQTGQLVVAHLAMFIGEVWKSQHNPRFPSREEFVAVLRAQFLQVWHCLF